MESWREELYHHGIPGQKWGERNGPPYPLSDNAHSLLEKKMNGLGTVSNQKKIPKLLSFINKSNQPRRLSPWRRPKTVKEEFSNLGHKNPLRRPAFVVNNCANTALTAVGRLKGYDVMPGWQKDKFGMYSGLSFGTIINCFKDADYECSEYSASDFDSQKKVENNLSELYKDGSYGIIGGEFKVGWKTYGHAMTWQVKKGKTYIGDSLNGAKASKIFDNIDTDAMNVLVLRCNDLDINWDEYSKHVRYS